MILIIVKRMPVVRAQIAAKGAVQVAEAAPTATTCSTVATVGGHSREQ